MRCTKWSLTAALAAIAVVFSLAGCTQEAAIPQIHSEGSRTQVYKSLSELAAKSSAIVIIAPTGQQRDQPLPEGYGNPDSAPTPFVTVKVLKVLRGDLPSATVQLVSPGIDENTGKQSLLNGGPYLVFLTPAMYGADDPAGGYVAVGGPAGVFASTGTNQFARVDAESTALPRVIDLAKVQLPAVLKSEQELLHEGP